MKFKLKILIIIIAIVLTIFGGMFIPTTITKQPVNSTIENNGIEVVQQTDIEISENILENTMVVANTLEEENEQDEVSEPQEEKKIITKYTTTRVNIRAGASTNTTIIKTVPINTKLQVVENEEEWIQVIEDDNTYYIYGKYLSDKKTKIPTTSRGNAERKTSTTVQTKGSISSNPLTRSKGVVYFNGHRETWYSQKVLPGRGLKIPGRHVDSRGLVCDGDGYICVASSDLAKGTIVETSLGTGKVYDSGCASGTIDIYTDWD